MSNVHCPRRDPQRKRGQRCEACDCRPFPLMTFERLDRMSDLEPADLRDVAWEAVEGCRKRAAVIARIRELHISGHSDSPFCDHCGFGWPCPTVRALDGGVS